MLNNKKQTSNNKNLYLIGFMGTGKSVVGQLAAKKLNLSFLDSDQEIEKKYGKSINQIFASLGENAFRKMEKEFIKSGHPKSNCLISCGGGLPIQDGMIDLLKSLGKVICLTASAESILERTSKNSTRPLLQTTDPLSKIKELLKKRLSKYNLADQIIATDDKSVIEVTEIIEQIYQE
tara:strand:- start:203 stop:736 length:534 start_codon:yes stop_codon:yes gene_type:complete